MVGVGGDGQGRETERMGMKEEGGDKGEGGVWKGVREEKGCLRGRGGEE